VLYAVVPGKCLIHDVCSTCWTDQPECVACRLQVQLQLLTATVKLFLKRPTENVQRLIQLVLSCATNETDNPDLRDRAYVYWRLLSTDPEVSVWLAAGPQAFGSTQGVCELTVAVHSRHGAECMLSV